MGTYLNPAKNRFQIAVNSDIFVDKTEMLCFLNTLVNKNQRFVCVSRPRRFGKTLATDVICAYYDREADNREMFENLKIACCDAGIAKNNVLDVAFGKSGDSTRVLPWDAYLGGFDVIRLTMTRFFKKDILVEDSLKKMQQLVIRDLKRAYPNKDYFDDTDLIQTIEDVYSTEDRQVVIVIDEWDAVFRVRKDDKDGQTQYLDFLRDLLKDNGFIALAYMTGILPIKKYGEHSALNMFTEYSIMYPRQLARYTGFTEDEVNDLCQKYHMNYDDVSAWYDGYVISDWVPPEDRATYREDEHSKHKISIYCPLSVVEAMSTGVIRDYWNKTETYEALAEYIRRDFDGLKEAVAVLMDGGRVTIDPSTYQNDMTSLTCRDDVMSLLIHLGYLGFDDERSEVFIPNQEILDEFKASTKTPEWEGTFRSFRRSLELLDATWAEDADKVAEMVEDAHNAADNKSYNDEAALKYAILLAYIAAEKYYTPLPELDSGKGYADVVYLPHPQYPDKPAMVVELKYDKSADSGLDQIHRQKYTDRLAHYKGNILLVAINYDSDARNDDPAFKHHNCRIERV